MPKPLNDRVGEYIFYSMLEGEMDELPEAWLEVKDKDGNPVEIKLKKVKEKE